MFSDTGGCTLRSMSANSHRSSRRRRAFSVACAVTALGALPWTAPRAVAACPLQTDLARQEIAFVSGGDGDPDVYVMRGDGSRLRQLTDAPGTDATIAWSVDGKRLAFTSERDGNPEIYVMRADGSQQRRITDHPAQDAVPSWSPDGTIVFHSNRTGDYDIYTVDPDDPALTVWNLTERPRGLEDLSIRSGDDIKPSWSRDGELIAFESYRDRGRANADIWVMGGDGSDLRRLVGAPGSAEWSPAWSPDGSAIAYMSSRNGNWDIFVSSRDGDERVLLTTPKTEFVPGWSSDGRAVLFTSNLAQGGADHMVDLGGVHFGTRLPAYVTFEEGFDMYVANVDGTCLTKVTDGVDVHNPTARPGGG